MTRRRKPAHPKPFEAAAFRLLAEVLAAAGAARDALRAAKTLSETGGPAERRAALEALNECERCLALASTELTAARATAARPDWSAAPSRPRRPRTPNPPPP